MNKRHAFTLIEMLVVIAIIAIVAGMVVNQIAGAKAAQKNAQVNAGKNKLMAMIENYQSKLNFYPPDNGNLATALPANYDATAAINPLLYELTGATNTNSSPPSIILFDTNVPIYQSTFSNLFGRSSVANSSTDEPHSFYIPQPKEYTNYSGYTLEGLLVPVVMVGPTGTPITNFWHYDSSTTNRHNLSGYDLWAEYVIGSKGGSNIIVTNGSWQQ
jgi:prepilin-type N-terminal cleavage/methylation domain-containing protein